MLHDPAFAIISRHFGAITFDLDGTLVDTFDDIAAACNQALEEAGLAARSKEDIRSFMGKGSDVLIRRCVGDAQVSDNVIETIKVGYWRHYLDVTGTHSRIIAGAREGVEAWQATGLKLAVVTNKPKRIAEALLTRTGFAPAFCVVIAGDTRNPLKPNPEPLLRACSAMGVEAGRTLHIGDSKADKIASERAGCSYAHTARDRFKPTPKAIAKRLSAQKKSPR